MTAPTTVDIKGWLDRADTARRESDDLYWKAAEGLFLANKEAGGSKKTQEQLATEIDRSQSTVSKYIKCWNAYGPEKPGDKPVKPWAQAWREASNKKRESKPGRTTKASLTPKSSAKSVADIDYSLGNTQPEPEPLDHDLPYFVRATGELIGVEYEEAVDGIPEGEWPTYRAWGDELTKWLELFSKALERRFGTEPEEDDPEFD